MSQTSAAAAHQPHAADTAIRVGSKSFAMASRLFDRTTRHHVWDLYTWCRACDDAVDGQTFGHGRSAVDAVARLQQLRDDTARALTSADGALDPPFSALRRVAHATALPPAFVHAHLDGFAMDVADRRYRSIDDTLDYCFHVAGVVGLMMAWVMDARSPAALLRGSDLGIGFQLTNIARDVGDDLVAGRCYLPGDWLEAAGASPVAGLSLAPDTARRLVPVVDRLLDDADRYYASAWQGLSALPPRSAWAVATARRVYRDIGLGVRRRGAGAWQTRVSTSTARKLGRTAQALVDVARTRAVDAATAPPRSGLWTPPLERMVG